jgi:Tol biopolymer transport system component
MVYQTIGTRDIYRVLKKVSLDGGGSLQLTDKASFAPALSPDGRLIACNYVLQAGELNKIAVISIDGGPPLKIFEVPGESDWHLHWTPDGRALADRPVRWMPDGQALAYAVTKGGISNIWIQPLAGGPLRQLTHFNTHQIFNFAWSHDGRLALSRSLAYNDVVIIRDIR